MQYTQFYVGKKVVASSKQFTSLMFIFEDDTYTYFKTEPSRDESYELWQRMPTEAELREHQEAIAMVKGGQ